MISQDLPDAVLAALAAHEGVRAYILPGTVVAYNQSANTADVRPGVRRAVPTNVDGETVTEALATVFAARVVWPGGSGGYFAASLSPGDRVLLLCCDDDPSDFLRTGEVSDPGDVRRNRPGHAVCIPGLDVKPDVGLVAAKAAVGGSSDAAALASRLDALVKVLKSWTVSAGDGGAALKAAVVAAFPGVPVVVPTPQAGTTTGSAVLKVGS